jgi:hypothetical protein
LSSGLLAVEESPALSLEDEEADAEALPLGDDELSAGESEGAPVFFVAIGRSPWGTSHSYHGPKGRATRL